jgi:sterol desaturase/sphingolipid hydroxylase (fatty acid hydroxylase superfamily)
LYPMLAVVTALFLALALSGPPEHMSRGYGAYLAGMVGFMVLVESLFPMQPRWKMTRVSFLRRDLPYLVMGAATLGSANYLAVVVVTHLSLSRGYVLIDLPVWLGVIAAILTTDFLWYWLHRLSHEGRGPIGRFLWRVHVAHHLPAQVYVFMHAIGHPLNAIAVRAILALPLYFLGFSPQVVFVAGVITGLQGLVSHFNVDIRTGWVNYVLMGTELHRFHHSADVTEAKNFGATVTLWDQLFGTFHYRPGVAPQRLGIDRPDEYPSDVQIGKVLLLPFRRHD